jgi:hypothetical protein
MHEVNIQRNNFGNDDSIEAYHSIWYR